MQAKVRSSAFKEYVRAIMNASPTQQDIQVAVYGHHQSDSHMHEDFRVCVQVSLNRSGVTPHFETFYIIHHPFRQKNETDRNVHLERNTLPLIGPANFLRPVVRMAPRFFLTVRLSFSYRPTPCRL